MDHGLRGLRAPAAPPYRQGPYEWDQHISLHKQNMPFSRVTLTEDFKRLPALNAAMQVADIALSTSNTYTDAAVNTAVNTALATANLRVTYNTDFEVLGTNAVTSDVAFATTVGGIKCTTHGANNDQVIILPHLDSGQSAWAQYKWGTENSVIWEAVIRTGSSVASTTLWAGLKLTNTSVVATDNDQVMFRYDGTPANWTAVISIAGTDTEVDLGATNAAVTADTNYYLKIEIDSSRKAHFYINNKKLYISSALTDDVDLIPYLGIHATTGAAKHFYIAGTRISRIIFE